MKKDCYTKEELMQLWKSMTLKGKVKKSETFPYNLYTELLEDVSCKPTKDMPETILYLLTTLKKQDVKILLYHYVSGYTYAKIGEICGVSKGYITCRINEIMIKLREPGAIQRLLYGITYYNQVIKPQDDRTLKQKMVARYKTLMNEKDIVIA